MANVIAVHSVGEMDTWLAADNRAPIFERLCDRYRLFRMPDQSKVAIIWENVDLEKLEAALASPEVASAKAKDTVIDPVEIFVEVEGAR
ncbi:MAG: hypothetical protein KDB18_05810 [Salinibacterium sp.]|nr:hypothetical protein [Salinibacterium sp.]